MIGSILRRLTNCKFIHRHFFNNKIGRWVGLHGLCKITNSSVGDYTYFGGGCTVRNTTIGKFCSIGPNFICGWGVHPLDGVSTSPTFYSVARQNGATFCSENKVEEYKPITIGNDVFIGANVMVMDGVTIGNGAVVGAGAIIASDVPGYAIVGGVPAKIIRYRFDQDKIAALQKMQWWNWDEQRLRNVERYFFDVDGLIENGGS